VFCGRFARGAAAGIPFAISFTLFFVIRAIRAIRGSTRIIKSLTCCRPPD
jgi:hypothetical protein